MEFLNQPVVKIILTALAAANSAVLVTPGMPPALVSVCGILSAVFVALGVTVNVQASRALRGARAENLALQAKLRGGAQ